MIFYYAIGGGLGHISRAISFLKSQNISNSDSIILATEQKQFDLNINKNIIYTNLESPILLRDLIENIIHQYSISKIYIDTFPFGIKGEFINLKTNIDKFLIARILKYDVYLNDISKSNLSIENPKTLFKCIYKIEKLNSDYESAISNFSNQFISLSLYDNQKFIESKENNIEPYYMIAHTGSLEELQVLMEHAKDYANQNSFKGKILIFSPNFIESDNFISLKFQYGINEYYPQATLMFTGCGFNTMNELRPFRKKHIRIPFKRRYDDQYLRNYFS